MPVNRHDIMRPALTYSASRGFSLAEMLIALVLFSLVFHLLTSGLHNISQGFQRQWQYLTAWRLASLQTEINPPPLPPGFTVSHQQQFLDGCLQIHATLTTPGGQQAKLSRLHCPAEK